ncbi:MAG: 5'-3' exonuclease H3TH domain-containing protein [Halothiobacillaceae bacterium]|nr:5'-3' exonuclease H3TH domain-containing protein [Halothiobacillaceae bacterium]
MNSYLPPSPVHNRVDGLSPQGGASATDGRRLGDQGRAYLIDSNIYIYRAWHGSTIGVRDSEGRALNAVHGFAEFLLRVLEDTQTNRIALAFDIPQENPYRREIFPAYKGQRSPPPEDLIPQFALCRALAKGLNLPIHTSERYEADDVIGTLATHLRTEGLAVTLLTADKDLTQLLEGADRWWNHGRSEVLDARGVERVWGVPPKLIADLLAITGDISDNIPGVPGIGRTTAARMLRKWGSLDGILDNLHAIGAQKFRGAPRAQKLMLEHETTVRFARRLTGIVCDVPLGDEVRTLWQPPAVADIEPLFEALRLPAYLRERWFRLVQTV